MTHAKETKVGKIQYKIKTAEQSECTGLTARSDPPVGLARCAQVARHHPPATSKDTQAHRQKGNTRALQTLLAVGHHRAKRQNFPLTNYNVKTICADTWFLCCWGKPAPKVGAKESWKGVLHTRVVPCSCGPNVQKGVVVARVSLRYDFKIGIQKK